MGELCGDIVFGLYPLTVAINKKLTIGLLQSVGSLAQPTASSLPFSSKVLLPRDAKIRARKRLLIFFTRTKRVIIDGTSE
jgi:hypothetical protein